MAPIELHLFVNNYEEWGYKCIGSEEDSKNFSNQVNGDQARYPPPPDQAFEACRSMDPSKKPPSNRPGKRPAPSSGPPDTPSKSTKPATSE